MYLYVLTNLVDVLYGYLSYCIAGMLLMFGELPNFPSAKHSRYTVYLVESFPVYVHRWSVDNVFADWWLITLSWLVIW